MLRQLADAVEILEDALLCRGLGALVCVCVLYTHLYLYTYIHAYSMYVRRMGR